MMLFSLLFWPWKKRNDGRMKMREKIFKEGGNWLLNCLI